MVAVVCEVLRDPAEAVFCAGVVFSLPKSCIFFAFQVTLRGKEGLGEGRLTFRWPQFIPSYHGGFGNPPPSRAAYLSELLKA